MECTLARSPKQIRAASRLISIRETRPDLNLFNDRFFISTFPSNFPVCMTGKLDEFLIFKTDILRWVSARNVEKRLGWRVWVSFFRFICSMVFVSYPSHKFLS